MSTQQKWAPAVLAVVAGTVMSGSALGQFTNGDFGTGDFTGWTITPTSGGTSTPAGTVEAVDIDGPGPLGSSLASKFAVGRINATQIGAHGMELSQVLSLTAGTVYLFDLDWAATSLNAGANAQGGIFTLFVESFDLATAAAGSTSATTPHYGHLQASFGPATTGSYRVGVRMARPFTIPATNPPTQWVDNVVQGVSTAVVGACCLTSGACFQGTSASCTLSGGVYSGDGSTCGTANCPQPGACCAANGTCSILQAAACAAAGGVYRGDGTDCATANCPQPPTGACCATDGTCSILNTFQCAAAAGTYRGDNTTCATAACPVPCPPITGQLVVGPGSWPVVHVLQTARLFRDGVPDTCTLAAVGGAPVVASYNADVYDFVNTSALPACVNFTLNTGGNCNLYGVAYIGGFDPTNVSLNYVASTGSSTGIPPVQVGMTFTVPGSTAFQIVVNDTNAVGVSTCANTYTFVLGGGTFNCTPGGPSCYANCDGSTVQPVLTVADFGCFLNAFAAGDSYANCDGSTVQPVLTVADFGCFLNAFAAGCS